MNKTAIKNYAIWARVQLIESAKQRAYEYEITDGGENKGNLEAVDGKLLTKDEQEQRKRLISEINRKGFPQVMEEAAYTWFNRFIALRFMEVNGYLPSKIRVFTDEAGAFKPEILKEAMTVELDGLDRGKVLDLLDKQDNEALYKYLLITQCNALNKCLPYMFERIANWTELLFPGNILRTDGILGRMVADIPEEDWTDQVQIIGWLYQYYNTELKDDTFALLKKNVKITKERVPSATQLFTPDWIVRYMVENSLGRTVINNLNYDIWADEEKAKIGRLKSQWRYYLDEAPQNEYVDTELRISEHNKYASGKTLPFVDTTLMDPCMGSGHILVYAFDVFIQIYREQGWRDRDAVRRIIEKNLFGLDIDERAAQLAYFAVMMKACKYDKRFLTRLDANGNPDLPQPHIYAIPESGHMDKNGNRVDAIDPDAVAYFVAGRPEIQENLDKLFTQMFDAKEYGSILQIKDVDFDLLYARYDETVDEISWHRQVLENDLLPLLQVGEMLSRQYDCVVTNPPYMAVSNGSTKVQEFVKKNYPDSKADLFAVFIERCHFLARPGGYFAMITQHSWMFLSSFEKLRQNIQSIEIVNMAHLGARAFEEIGGEVVQTTTFVVRNTHIDGYLGLYCRLVEPTTQQGKEDMFLSGKNRYAANQTNFSKIPGSPVAYWVSERFMNIFTNRTIGEVAKPRQGLATGCNDLFIRQWYEVSNNKICYNAHSISEARYTELKWFPYNKGGEFRKWYGNNDYVVNWENNGFLIRNFKNEEGKLRSRPQNTQFYFRESFSWSLVSSGTIAFRYKPFGHIFDIAGMSCFSESNLLYLLALCNSPIALQALAVIAPTINFQAGDIANIPVIFQQNEKDKVEKHVNANISLSKSDWDSYETSWDFKRHPMV